MTLLRPLLSAALVCSLGASCDSTTSSTSTQAPTPEAEPEPRPEKPSPLRACAISGEAGTQSLCNIRLAGPAATALQLSVHFDPRLLRFEGISCPEPDSKLDTCTEMGTLKTGHAVATTPAKATDSGRISVVMYHPTAPQTPLSRARIVDGALHGDAQLVGLRYSLRVTVPATRPAQVELRDLAATDGTATTMSASLIGGGLILVVP